MSGNAMNTMSNGIMPVRFARHAGMEYGFNVTALPEAELPEWVEGRTRREAEILRAMLAVQDQHGGRLMSCSRAHLRASGKTMHDLFYAGLVNGAGSPDARGMGNTPESSWWWLTERGEQIARAIPGRRKGTP
jgi:hypothetical protein